MDRLSSCDQIFVEGYAKALDDVLFKLTGTSNSSKSYDPMTCGDTMLYSYAFNMKDGGRSHPVSDYEDIEEILDTLLNEAVREIKES